MRVLWFSVTPSRFGSNNTLHNGGGWIASLESLISGVPGVELAVAFEYPSSAQKTTGNGVTYYPIPKTRRLRDKLFPPLGYQDTDDRIISAAKSIIEDFKPDVIQVFGTEWNFGLIASLTKVPVVIHLQGSIPSYSNARFPPGYTLSMGLRWNGLKIKKSIEEFFAQFYDKFRIAREYRIFKECSFFMGRTLWDHSLVKLLSPTAKYFHCNEVLREVFYEKAGSWSPSSRDRLELISVVSGGLLKGHDVILKTAALLKQHTTIPFVWKIYGTSDNSRAERLTSIKSKDVSVDVRGTLMEDELCDEMLKSDLFIHPSYIDNSPNSVCEAQLLGMPVIATAVGGIPSLIENQHTGLLVAANDPFHMAESIVRFYQDRIFSSACGDRAHRTAELRHSKKEICNEVIKIYEDLISRKAI